MLLAQTCDDICKEEEDVEADVKLRLSYKAVVSRVLGTYQLHAVYKTAVQLL